MPAALKNDSPLRGASRRSNSESLAFLECFGSRSRWAHTQKVRIERLALEREIVANLIRRKL